MYVLVDLDECLLNGIQGVIFVLDHAHGHGKRSTMILVEESSKSCRISCLYALDQVMITLVGGAV